MTQKRTLRFDRDAPPLEEQIRGQLPRHVNLKRYQRASKAVTMLEADGWVSRSVAHAIRKRIIMELEKLTVTKGNLQ